MATCASIPRTAAPLRGARKGASAKAPAKVTYRDVGPTRMPPRGGEMHAEGHGRNAPPNGTYLMHCGFVDAIARFLFVVFERAHEYSRLLPHSVWTSRFPLVGSAIRLGFPPCAPAVVLCHR